MSETTPKPRDRGICFDCHGNFSAFQLKEHIDDGYVVCTRCAGERNGNKAITPEAKRLFLKSGGA